MYGSNSRAKKCSIADDLDDCARCNEDHRQQLLAIRYTVVFTQALQLTAGTCHTFTLHTPHMQGDLQQAAALWQQCHLCSVNYHLWQHIMKTKAPLQHRNGIVKTTLNQKLSSQFSHTLTAVLSWFLAPFWLQIITCNCSPQITSSKFQTLTQLIPAYPQFNKTLESQQKQFLFLRFSPHFTQLGDLQDPPYPVNN